MISLHHSPPRSPSGVEEPGLRHSRGPARLDVVLPAKEARKDLLRHREHPPDIGGLRGMARQCRAALRQVCRDIHLPVVLMKWATNYFT